VRVLVVNAGSSSLKVDIVDGGRAVESFDGLPATPPDVDAVGHRIVHGGAHLTEPVVIDATVERELHALVELAPLHQPKSLDGLAAAQRLLPDVPHVACFDTAFHATMTGAARTYAVPRRWRTELGIRRYGFHGLAHDWASDRAARLVGRSPDGLRVVVAHLGSGASACAVVGGRSVDTTMGFTPTAGLVMATRSGDLDPSAVAWVTLHAGVPTAEVDHALDHASGLLALAGDADMRHVLDASGAGDDRAALAVAVWVHRARGQLAAMAAAAGGIDVLAFSGGVGENAPVLRQRVVEGLGFLGLAIDAEADAAAVGGAEGDVSAAGAVTRTVVVHAREDLVIARQVREVLAAS
jgi:acetate kinase